MNASDSSMYNILFIGPTGSGKSHLINCLFNSTVSVSSASTDSVTKEIHFYQGRCKYKMRESGFHEKDVNIIDTIAVQYRGATWFSDQGVEFECG